MVRVFFYFSIWLAFGFTAVKPAPAFAEILTQTPLDSALEHYKNGDYSKAMVDWHTLLQDKKYQHSPELLYNLALTEFKLNDFGSALAHLRKAQVINPISYKIYKTMESFKKTIAEKEFYHVESESLAFIVFSWLPKSLFIGIFILFLIAGTVVAMRQKANEMSFKRYLRPYAFFLLAALIPTLLIYAQNTLRSQVIATFTGNSSAKIRTSFSSEAPELGTINVGDVFQVIKPETDNTQGWVAVTTSQVPLGWIQAGSYIVHRGELSTIANDEEPVLKIDPNPSTN